MAIEVFRCEIQAQKSFHLHHQANTCPHSFPWLAQGLHLVKRKVKFVYFLKTKDNFQYILELTIGFETNINNNAERKHLKYSRLVSDLRSQYTSVTFVNLSMSALGIYANSCLSFLKMCDSLSIDNQHKCFLISKLSTISIRTTYYIFCCRD